jgi:hypothetical protein
METYTEPKAFADNPRFLRQKQACLAKLHDDMIDRPIVHLINAFNRLPYCFTLQCCYGHFVYYGQDDPENLEPLPLTNRIGKVDYRIAYIAFCIDNSAAGISFFNDLKKLTQINPQNIQLCSAGWFWEQQVNSYALQVEPDRFKKEDRAMLGYREAIEIEKIRNDFFARLAQTLQRKEAASQ